MNFHTTQHTWLITGVAGFIGSNLLEYLLSMDQIVVGIDNFSTGTEHNLLEVKSAVGEQLWKNFTFMKGDISDYSLCRAAVKGVDFVLHQAALGSVPRSIADPLNTNAVNISGFLNVLDASMKEQVKSFTYAASSSTYGDSRELPKVEDRIGKPLSPYAVTKNVNELYADVYASTYGFKSIGLRYFNVFGQRQDPNGEYAAVIPKWTQALLSGCKPIINGDGETSRDFCHVDNVVQMNVLAATASEANKNEVYNVALGDRTTLNELFELIKDALRENGIQTDLTPNYEEFRLGDVRHSQACVSKAINRLGYRPTTPIKDGITKSIPWYVNLFQKQLDYNKNKNKSKI